MILISWNLFPKVKNKIHFASWRDGSKRWRNYGSVRSQTQKYYHVTYAATYILRLSKSVSTVQRLKLQAIFLNSAECSRYFLLKSKCKGEVVGVAVNKCFSLITNCEYLSTSIDIIQSKKNIDCVKSRQIRMHKSIFCLIANSTTAYSITFWHTLLPS